MPCQYLTYSLAEELTYSSGIFGPDNSTVFELYLGKNTVKIREEVLLYPFETLVAEYGGTLGLFCGFSFLLIWDGLVDMILFLRGIMKNSKIFK